MVIGTVISKNIEREIITWTKKLNKVSDGDFTAISNTKRKDEFKILSTSLSKTTMNVQ